MCARTAADSGPSRTGARWRPTWPPSRHRRGPARGRPVPMGPDGQRLCRTRTTRPPPWRLAELARLVLRLLRRRRTSSPSTSRRSATMIMGLSVRLFGLSSWSVLLPQALAGIATVVVLYAAVRRSFGPAAATIAGVVMAADAGQRPDLPLQQPGRDPDPAARRRAARAFIRSLETGRLRWVVLAAAFVGLGFDAKYLQAYLVLPAFALTYAVAAPGASDDGSRTRRSPSRRSSSTSLLVGDRRRAHPDDLRPYIGGSRPIRRSSCCSAMTDSAGSSAPAGRRGGGGGGLLAGARPPAPVQRRVRRPGQRGSSRSR